jgi:mono/diheme cytochrome c family protein
MTRRLLGVIAVVAGCLGVCFAAAAEPADRAAAERGRAALLGRCFDPPTVAWSAYENAWKAWGVKERPADYARAFRDRYGLSPAPYPNGGLPMGLRAARGLLGKSLGNDCLICHGSSVCGQPVIGLGNASLDFKGLSEDLAGGKAAKLLPFDLSHVRGTIEAEAVVMYVMQFRDTDLNLRLPARLAYRDHLCQDIPAWWLLKKKKTMFHTGGADARSVRHNMTFLLSPLNSADTIKKLEPVFRDIKAYLLTLEPPRYPFPVDRAKAARGEKLFVRTCAKCHGTYGPGWTYPNKVVPLDLVGTDGTLVENIPLRSWEHYGASWFAREKGPDGKVLPFPATKVRGYQAPPLDGVWATAPYFHNGSVPTVYHVLNSKARPRVYTRSYRTEKEDYDPARLGWKITVLDGESPPGLSAYERRKIYDTTQPGQGNGGHTFGDAFTEEQRREVIEYLKTL